MKDGFIHTASALIDYINDVGFLPLLNIGIAGWSADDVVDDDCRYTMRPDGSWEWPLWEWKGEILREDNSIECAILDTLKAEGSMVSREQRLARLAG